jgi:hypothetical protein
LQSLYRTSEGETGVVVRSGDDVYAGKDGNIYRRGDGGWQKYENGSWSPAVMPGTGPRVPDPGRSRFGVEGRWEIVVRFPGHFAHSGDHR